MSTDISTDQLTTTEATAWRNLLTAHGRVIARLDNDLINDSDMSLAEFEVLEHLVEQPDQQLRMNELADLARLSPSGLTRRFDALVRRGWVVRERCDDDRRGVYARLTEAGRQRVTAAQPVHLLGVHRYFLDLLDDEHLSCLNDVMGRIAETNAPDLGRN